MPHIAVITTSFPGDKLGSEAAGSFVSDFAEELAKHAQVTVLAPELGEGVAGESGARDPVQRVGPRKRYVGLIYYPLRVFRFSRLWQYPCYEISL